MNWWGGLGARARAKGPTKTGKSTFINIITSLLGETNVVSIPIHDFERSFDRVGIFLKLANFLADLSPKEIKDVSKFKQYTGDDLIRADNKYEKPFEFRSYAKHGWSCNEIPVVKIDDSAFWERWRIVLVNKKQYFDGQPGTDNALKYSLKTELPGILNWALVGLRRLLDQMHFSNNDSWDTTKRLWWIHSDGLGEFMYGDIVRVTSAGTITKNRFFELYVDWCTLQGISAWSKEKLGREISKRFSKTITTGYKGPAKQQVKTWEGVEEILPDADSIKEMFEELEAERAAEAVEV